MFPVLVTTVLDAQYPLQGSIRFGIGNPRAARFKSSARALARRRVVASPVWAKRAT